MRSRKIHPKRRHNTEEFKTKVHPTCKDYNRAKQKQELLEEIHEEINE